MNLKESLKEMEKENKYFKRILTFDDYVIIETENNEVEIIQ